MEANGNLANALSMGCRVWTTDLDACRVLRAFLEDPKALGITDCRNEQ